MHISVFYLQIGHSVPAVRSFAQPLHKHMWPHGMHTDFICSVRQNKHFLFLRASTLISTVISNVGALCSGATWRSFLRYLTLPGEASINSCCCFLPLFSFWKSFWHSLNFWLLLSTFFSSGYFGFGIKFLAMTLYCLPA